MRERWFLLVLVLGFLYELIVLYLPRRASFHKYPLGVPNPLVDIPPLKPLAIPLVFVATSLVLAIIVRQWSVLVRHPRRTVVGVFLLGACLHLALLGSLADGFRAFHHRVTHSGHAQFVFEAVKVKNLEDTLRNYEAFALPRTYLAAKGPGVLVFFYGLRVAANAPGLRSLAAAGAPALGDLREWAAPHQVTESQIVELQHLLGLLFVLCPLLAYLPVFFVYAIGREFRDTTLGLLGALLYPLMPGVALLVGHLDYFLFPTLVTGVVALFMQGLARRRLAPLAICTLLLAVYFTLTISAIALLGFLLPYAGLSYLRRARNGEERHAIALDSLRAAGVMVLVLAAVLVPLSLWLDLDFVTRYQYARALQRDWGGVEYNMFWVTANLLGWLLAFGLAQAWLVATQQGRSLWAIVRGHETAIDTLAISWFCLLIGLVAFGRHHGETNRLWTFLSPVGCLLTAQLMRDTVPPPRYFMPLWLFLIALVLMRCRLSYL